MAGILSALREGKFTCFGPAGTESVDVPVSMVAGRRLRPYGRIIEKPRPESAYTPMSSIADNDGLLFRHFVDGSQRTTNAGHIVDPKHRYLPLLIAQIGGRDNGVEYGEDFELRVTIPLTFCSSLIHSQKRIYRRRSRWHARLH